MRRRERHDHADRPARTRQRDPPRYPLRPATRPRIGSAEQQAGHDRFAWARHQLHATEAGTIRVTLAPNTAGMRMLRYVRAKGWSLHIRVWITYTPTGGHPRDHVTTIRVAAPRATRAPR